VFTSEAGLVARGALASYGADFYYWGYQTGNQAALFLKTGSASGLKPEPVAIRRRIYNPEMAARYQIRPDSTFTAYKPGR
jgi:putative ABC transport system substrate-binding protein